MKKVLKITESQYKSLLNEQILMGGIYPWMGGEYELLKSLAKGVYSVFDCSVYKKDKSDSEDEKDINWLDYGHCIVDNVSMAVSVVPVIGTAASGILDLLNSVVYLGEAIHHSGKGEFEEAGWALGFAGLSALGIWPGVTELRALTKASKGVMKNTDNILKELSEQGIKKGSNNPEDIKKVNQVIENYSKGLSDVEKKQLGEVIDILGHPQVKEGIENMGKFNDFTKKFMLDFGLKKHQLKSLIGSKDFNKILKDNGGDIYKALNTNETKKLISNIKFQAGSAILMGGAMATFNEYKKDKENQVSNVDNLSEEEKNKIIDIIEERKVQLDAGMSELERLMKEQGINTDEVSEDEKGEVITDTIIVHVSKQKERVDKMSDSDNVTVGDINTVSLKKLNIPKIIRDDFTSWIKTKEKQSNLKKENVMINKKIIISEKQFKKLFSTNGDVLSEQTKSYYFDCIRDYYRIKSVYETRGVPSIIIENGVNQQLFFLNDGQIALSRSGKYGTPKMIGIYNCKEEWVKTHELNTKQDLYEYINKFKSVTVKSKSTPNTVSSLDDVKTILDKNGIKYTDGLESKKGVKYLKLKPDNLYRVMLDEINNIIILSDNPKYECYIGKYKIKDDDIKITKLSPKKNSVDGVCQSDQDANTDINESTIVRIYRVLIRLSEIETPLDSATIDSHITTINNTGINNAFSDTECIHINEINDVLGVLNDENFCKVIIKYNEKYKTNIVKDIAAVNMDEQDCKAQKYIYNKWTDLGGTKGCKNKYNI
jgi:hypothetical protein